MFVTSSRRVTAIQRYILLVLPWAAVTIFQFIAFLAHGNSIQKNLLHDSGNTWMVSRDNKVSQKLLVKPRYLETGQYNGYIKTLDFNTNRQKTSQNWIDNKRYSTEQIYNRPFAEQIPRNDNETKRSIYNFSNTKVSSEISLEKVETNAIVAKEVKNDLVIESVLDNYNINSSGKVMKMDTPKQQSDIAKGKRQNNYFKKYQILWHLRKSYVKRKWGPFIPSLYPQNVTFEHLNDSHQLGGILPEYQINRYPYTTIINPSQKCINNNGNSGNITLLFIIKSSPEHFSRRWNLRNTWADENNIPNLRTVFSFGLPKDTSTFEKIKLESLKYRDILLRDFMDSYNNLTLKTISGVNWAVTYCSVAKYVVSADDDMYVATHSLMKYLEGLPPSETKKLYAGHMYKDVTASRYAPPNHPFRKWVVSYEEYPYRTYPNYIFGGLIIMSMEIAMKINLAILYTKIFRLEDIYIGIVASKLGIVPTHIKFVHDKFIKLNSENFGNVLASHHYESSILLKTAWMCHLCQIYKNENCILCIKNKVDMGKKRQQVLSKHFQLNRRQRSGRNLMIFRY